MGKRVDVDMSISSLSAYVKPHLMGEILQQTRKHWLLWKETLRSLQYKQNHKRSTTWSSEWGRHFKFAQNLSLRYRDWSVGKEFSSASPREPSYANEGKAKQSTSRSSTSRSQQQKEKTPNQVQSQNVMDAGLEITRHQTAKWGIIRITIERWNHLRLVM